jgi:iron-sulfur cluster repair protein YtfE (RIC family)
MGKRQHLSESLRAVMADHEILSIYIERFNRLFVDDSPGNVQKEIGEIRLILNDKIMAHFAYEEEHIFPALLQGDPSQKTSDAVSVLHKEHVSLRKEAQRLSEMLTDEDSEGNLTDLLRKAMLDFFISLEKHAAKENELFPSLM